MCSRPVSRAPDPNKKGRCRAPSKSNGGRLLHRRSNFDPPVREPIFIIKSDDVDLCREVAGDLEADFLLAYGRLHPNLHYRFLLRRAPRARALQTGFRNVLSAPGLIDFSVHIISAPDVHMREKWLAECRPLPLGGRHNRPLRRRARYLPLLVSRWYRASDIRAGPYRFHGRLCHTRPRREPWLNAQSITIWV